MDAMRKSGWWLLAGALLLAGCSSPKPGKYVLPPSRVPSPAAKPQILPPASLALPASPRPAASTTTVAQAVSNRPASQQVVAPAPGSVTPPTATNPPPKPPLPAVVPQPAPAVPSVKTPQGSTPSVPPGTTRAPYLIRAGDDLVIYLRGIPQEQMIEDQVDESGYINMPYINEVMAGGRTSSDLGRHIRQSYIDGKIYRNVMVNVIIPSQSYYVRGEVRQPGRFPLSSGLTLVQAIAAAGGYTEFAKSTKVQLLRGATSTYYDAKSFEARPERDIPIEAGDVIVVHRSMF